MGQGIDNWATLRAVAEKYDVPITEVVPRLEAEIARLRWHRDMLLRHHAWHHECLDGKQ